jgi:transposase
LLLRARESASVLARIAPAGDRLVCQCHAMKGGAMVDVVEESVQLVSRVCAIDIGKAGLVACVRVPQASRPDRRVQEVREYAAHTPALLELADWLRCERVELVAMEASSDYWKPVFYLLEAEGFACWLLNARHVKNVPGRPKTDRLDAVWLAKVVERGMCRPSLVHPKPIRQLRDVTRYRRSLVREQTREKQRLEKTLEDAQIKLDSVISDLHGVSGRRMLQAMIDGQRDPKTLAEMAYGSMRRKIPQLRQALTGHFADHHAFICATMLRRIDALAADIADLDSRIEEMIGPFAQAVEKLDEITGIGVRSAQEIIAEIGVDMAMFPTAAHLVSWAKFCPIDAESAGRKGQLHRQGQPLASRHHRRGRRRTVADEHLHRRALPPPGPPARQETRHRRGRQLGAHHHLASII